MKIELGSLFLCDRNTKCIAFHSELSSIYDVLLAFGSTFGIFAHLYSQDITLN